MTDDIANLKNLEFPALGGGLRLMTTGVYVQYGVAMVPKMERSCMQRMSMIYGIYSECQYLFN